MSKTTFVRARMEPHLKQEAEHILHVLGITPTQAVHMLYKQVVLQRAWPFDLKIPNDETIRAMQDADQGKTFKAKSVKDLLEAI